MLLIFIFSCFLLLIGCVDIRDGVKRQEPNMGSPFSPQTPPFVDPVTDCPRIDLPNQYDLWMDTWNGWLKTVRIGPYMGESHDEEFVYYLVQTRCPSQSGGDLDWWSKDKQYRFMQTNKKVMSWGANIEIFDCHQKEMGWRIREVDVFGNLNPSQSLFEIQTPDEQTVGRFKETGFLSKDVELTDESGDVIVMATRDDKFFKFEVPFRVTVLRPQHRLADPRIIVTFLTLLEFGTKADGCTGFMTTGILLIVLAILLLLCVGRFVAWPRFKKWRAEREEDSGPETGMGEHIDIDMDTSVLDAVELAKAEAAAVRAAKAAAASDSRSAGHESDSHNNADESQDGDELHSASSAAGEEEGDSDEDGPGQAADDGDEAGDELHSSSRRRGKRGRGRNPEQKRLLDDNGDEDDDIDNDDEDEDDDYE